MKKLLILLFSILISFNSYGETETDYYENGHKWSEINYKDGKQDGKKIRWHRDGLKLTEINYKDGKQVSETRYKYYWDGQIKSETNYKDGKCISGDC